MRDLVITNAQPATYLRATDVAQRLGVSDQTVRRMVQRGILRAVRTHSRGPLRFAPDKLAQDLARLEGQS